MQVMKGKANANAMANTIDEHKCKCKAGIQNQMYMQIMHANTDAYHECKH